MENKKLSLIFAVVTLGWIGTVIALAIGSHFAIHRFDTPPVQPVEFSHTLHVNDLNLECLFCHEMAEKSIHATIPEASVCLSCHEGADIENPKVKEMMTILQNEGELKWDRVFKVKDHVYFSHRVHTVVAKLACQECHGSVENMTVAVKASGGSSDRGFLEMGWCLTCHKRHGAPHECITCHK
ncbi:cytochrome c3 family protein [candidate division KSB1 bacterium]|nr:cytochrome c3 family protein [candidate division KSB1 bacterium]